MRFRRLASLCVLGCVAACGASEAGELPSPTDPPTDPPTEPPTEPTEPPSDPPTEPQVPPQPTVEWGASSLLGIHDAPLGPELLDLFPAGGGFVVQTRYSTDFDWLSDLGPSTSWARTHGFEPVIRIDYARPDGTAWANGAATPGATIPPEGQVGWCLARAGGGPSRDAGGEHLDCYLAYVDDAVSAAPDVHTWVIGNEMNMALEAKSHPNGVIDPGWYAHVYRQAQARIRSLPGHADDAVFVGAVAPGAKKGGVYESGKDYLTRLLYALQPDEVGGVALHAYGGWVRPCDNGGVAPLQAFEWGSQGGLGYKNQAQWIDGLGYSRVPLLITEMSAHMHTMHGPANVACGSQADAYLTDRKPLADFVRAAYKSLHEWNQGPSNHDIAGGVWFTWHDEGSFASESLQLMGELIEEAGLGTSPVDNPYQAFREVAAQGLYPHGDPNGFGTCAASTEGAPLFADACPYPLRGALRDGWQKNGGVQVFGYAIESASCQADARGRVLYAQHTQRARLEYHPELAGTPYAMSLGLVGRAVAPQAGVNPDAWSSVGAPHAAGCQFVGADANTGHYVCGKILSHWKSHGVNDPSLDAFTRSLRLFGLPISGPVTYEGRTVQWFERARLELHPENAAPFDVLGGLLGCEASGISGWGCQ